MSKARVNPMMEWNTIPWCQLERRVFKLQKRIFKASQRGDVKAVHRLQKTLMRSWSARCLAVRQVTQDNTGKKTAGIDGIKQLVPSQRLKLVSMLHLTHRAQPVCRVFIPKPGSSEKRGLGIPTIHDRCVQTLVKLGLEPEWEAKFEPNSYGFRPSRSCHDAIEAIFSAIRQKPKFVLDADLEKCFDRIDQSALLAKLKTFPTLRRQVQAWLSAGVMERGALFPTKEGVPQGGCCSPLMANIALHGMEAVVSQVSKTARLIRYCDDFVVLHEDITVVQACQQALQQWLGGIASVVSKACFEKLDHLIFQQLRAWARRRHPNKSLYWIIHRYWRMESGENWRFSVTLNGQPMHLLKHRDTPIVRHIKVQGNRSPYDGDWLYWSTRLGSNPEVPTRVARLLKRQKGQCPACGLFFKDGDQLDIDHILALSQGGKDEYKNLQLLHRHCHVVKTKRERATVQS
ncbi:reverse transcriptase N-terminal domain-containing protein (plasmid) [Phormidium sp. CLA17]|uniref:reverse transcriptase N-terminal domain-containing protein n=1 Tax=Leptolyngbya sp. Cla-17 TaxID=2803751 RepID=UPI00149261AE|nr:reverse transcriptase N-terminal domain-containing protein [Leptolyngbya sp. Cla-17]